MRDGNVAKKFKCANVLTRKGGVGVEEIPPSNPSDGVVYYDEIRSKNYFGIITAHTTNYLTADGIETV